MMRSIKTAVCCLISSILVSLAVGDEPTKEIANPAVPHPTAPHPTAAEQTEPAAQDSKPSENAEKPVSFWMEKKLEYSQEILRGLAVGDLETVAEKAEQMRVVSRIEGWVRNRTPGYRAQFQAFEFANAEILRNAKADNLDGAAMGFQQLTISCVSCHKMLRDVD